MASTLDLRAPSISIKFDKGKNLNPIFYYLAPDNSIINLTGYTARMQTRVAYTDALPVWDLTTTNGKLVIVTGNAVLSDGTVVIGAYGIQLNVPATDTAAIVGTTPYIFDLELITPTATVLPFIKGTLTPYEEVTK